MSKNIAVFFVTVLSLFLLASRNTKALVPVRNIELDLSSTVTAKPTDKSEVTIAPTATEIPTQTPTLSPSPTVISDLTKPANSTTVLVGIIGLMAGVLIALLWPTKKPKVQE